MNTIPEAIVLRRLYWSSFWLRVSAALGALVLTTVWNLPMLEDALYYSDRASEVSQCWLSGEQSPWLTEAMAGRKTAWVMIGILAAFYCLTGGVPILPLALVAYCLLTSYTPVLAYRAARQFGVPERGALTSARLIAYTPAFAFWSAALYKEGLILIALFLILEHTLRLQQSFRPMSVLVLGVCLLVMFGLRFYMGTILSVCVLVGLFLPRRNPDTEDATPAVLRQALVLLVVVTAFSLFGLIDRVEQMLSVRAEENLSEINRSRLDLARSASGYLSDVDVSNPEAAVRFLPVGMAYFLTVPFPWQFGSLRQNMAIPETLFWIVIIYPLALRGIGRAARGNPSGTLFLMLCALAMCTLYAVSISNIGTAYRERIQVWAILALFAGWGWSRAPQEPNAEEPDTEELDEPEPETN